jgi:hypothetical protein
MNINELIERRKLLMEKIDRTDITIDGNLDMQEEVQSIDREIEEKIHLKKSLSSDNSEKRKMIKLTDKAKSLHINPRTIKNWIKKGKVQGKKFTVWFVEDFTI